MTSRDEAEKIPGTPVWYLDEGVLRCQDHQSSWCAHIGEVIMSAQDSRAIISRAKDLQFTSVPVLPTEGIFVRVWLDVLPRDKFLAKAYLQSPSDAEADRMCTGDDHFIGFFSEGEGMAALRACVWESLDDLIHGDVSCSSLGHSWTVDLEAKKLHESGLRGEMMNAWCMKWYKKCSPCYNREGRGLDFDADLIPDAPVRDSWLRARPPRRR